MYFKPKPSLFLHGLELGAGALFFLNFPFVTISLVKYSDLFSLGITVDMACIVFHFQVNIVALIAHDKQP